jgi:hypothetical protein
MMFALQTRTEPASCRSICVRAATAQSRNEMMSEKGAPLPIGGNVPGTHMLAASGESGHIVYYDETNQLMYRDQVCNICIWPYSADSCSRSPNPVTARLFCVGGMPHIERCEASRGEYGSMLRYSQVSTSPALPVIVELLMSMPTSLRDSL